MSDFMTAVLVTLEWEKGFVDNCHDQGGATNFGLSQRSYPTLDIRSITRDQAVDIYQRDYWNRYGYGRINSQCLATKALDTAVNMGAHRAALLLQSALGVTVDGYIGPHTIAAANCCDALGILTKLREFQAFYYHEIVKNNPTQQVFLEGWLRRAREV